MNNVKRMFLFGLIAMLIVWSVVELTAVTAETVCFEDYRWGQTLADTKNQLKNKNKNFNSMESSLFYEDKIFGEPCNVILVFTPKSKLLAAIDVSWDTTSVGSGLKTLLTKKYGEPIQSNQFIEKYYWLKFDSDSTPLILDYSFIKTSLNYYGEKYWKKYEQETQKITEKEINRF